MHRFATWLLATIALALSPMAAAEVAPEHADGPAAEQPQQADDAAPQQRADQGQADEPPSPDAAAAEQPEAEQAPQEGPRIVEARERLAGGRMLGESGDLAGALVEFRRAYELLEGHELQYLVDYNIGRCYEGLHRYDLAIVHYRQYLNGAPADADNRADVGSRIAAFERLLATIILDVNRSDYEVWIDGRRLGENLREILVPGGTHTIEVRAEGYLSDQEQVDVPARTEATVELELLEPVGIPQTYFWAAVGATLAAAIAGAVVGSLALADYNNIQDRAGDEVQKWTITDADNQSMRRLSIAADVLFGTAALFGVAAIVLAIFTDWQRDQAPNESRATLWAGGAPTPRGGVLALGGRF